MELHCEDFNPLYIYEGFSGAPVFDEIGNVFAILRKKLNRSLGAISIYKAFSFLSKNGITVETDYEKFERNPFSKNWFIEHSEKIINNAGPRYTQYANVELDYAKFFDAIARNKNFQLEVFNQFSGIKKKLNKIHKREDKEFQEILATIQKALQPLFETIDCITKLSIDKSISWDEISKFSIESYKLIDSELTKLNSLNKNETGIPNHTSRKYDFEEREIRSLLDSIHQTILYSDSIESQLSNNPFLLLKGKAGEGKTHLLCDIAVKRIEKDEPTLMFYGQHFNGNEPWQQIISSLDLKCSKTEFLELLNDLGAKKEKKVLIFIDALNEGAGKEIWNHYIITFISDIKKYKWIGVVFSIRTPFEQVIIPKHLIEEGTLLQISHSGFKGNEYKAVREYFNYYGIELFSVPILDNEFSNPLFLKTFCEAFKKKGYYRLPKGAQKFSFVFNLFIEQKNIEISEKIDADPKLNILNKALNAFAETFVQNDLRSINREEAHKICENVINSRTWSHSLLFHMISEGVLFESMIFDNKENQWIDTVDFAYERFSDFIKGNYLSEFFKTENLEEKIIQKIFIREELWYNETVIQALSILLPERFDKELYEYFPEYKNHEIIVGAFFESLIWRSYSALNDEKISNYKSYLIENDIDFTVEILQVFLTVASDPNHIFNANYLHNKLWNIEVAKRDVGWTVPIFNWYKDGAKTIIDSYIDWSWSDDDKSHIDDEALLLSSTVLSWFLTSSNRFLRDDATKALITLLKNRPTVLNNLLDKFNGINDMYVAERLYAIAYGCVLLTNNKEIIKSIAQKIYDLVFKEGHPPVSFLLRDYARNSIEKAEFLEVGLEIDPANIRPPYESDWIEPFSYEEVKRYKIEWSAEKKRKDEEIAQSHLYESIMGFEDFARYIIGTNHGMTNWTSTSIKQKKAYYSFKDSLTGKAKSVFKLYSDFIKFKYIYENVSGTIIDKLAEKILSDINDKIPSVENQLIKVLSNKEQTIFINSIKPYLHLIHNSKKEKDTSFDLSVIQRFIIQKVFELGWTQDNFGTFDFSINRYSNVGRSARKKERIGKKYQWIALHEILARLADNFEYKEKYASDNFEICQGPWHDKFRRDIDPGILIRKQQDYPLPQFVGVFDNDYNLDTSLTYSEWLKTDDIPGIKNLIEFVDFKGDKWLKLEGNYSWAEEVSSDKDRYEQPQKDLWLQIRSYLVKKSKKKSFYNWAKEQDFMGRWMPESSDRYEYFLRESYWAPSYRYIKQPYYGYEEYYNPSNEKTQGKVSVKIMITTETFLKEVGSSIYDCSMDDSLSVTLPCEYIVKNMGLSFTDRDGYLIDGHNNLIAFDPSVWDSGKGGLLIKKEAFKKFLDDNNLDIVFTLLGEKMILGNSSVLPRMEVSGAYILDEKDDITGNYTIRMK